MAALIRAFNWPQALLDKPDHWPQSLRFALGICLNTSRPAAIYWGPEHILLYNDAYAAILGDKHPWALGRSVHEVWPEIWDLIDARIAKVIGEGEAVWPEDELLPMPRRGFIEERYFNFTASPIRDEGDVIAGIFNAVTETSGQVILERRTRLLGRLERGIAAARDAYEACTRAVEVLIGGTEDIPFCLIYKVTGEASARQVELIAAAGLAPGTPASPSRIAVNDEGGSDGSWPFTRVLETGKLEIVEELRERFGMTFPGGAWPEGARSAAVIPLHLWAVEDADGLMILGINPRQAFDEGYRSFVDAVIRNLRDAILRARIGEGQPRRSKEYGTVVDFALNCVHESAFLIDSAGHFLYVNREATRSLGYTEEELLSLGVPAIDPDFPGERWSGHWSSTAKEGRSRTFETRHKAKDGRIFPVEINSNYFKYNGRLYSMALARDISERKRIEAERQRAAEQHAVLEYALNQVHEGAFLIDSGGRFLYVNGEAARALGYSREELMSMGVPDIDPNYPAVRWPIIWQELLEKGPLTFETIHRAKDGRLLPVEITGSRFGYGGQAYCMALVRDITERKAAEEQMHLLMREVNHRAKNLLAVVQAIVRQTAGERDPQLFAQRLGERIAALAASHDLLVKSEWRGVEVSKLVRIQLSPFEDLIGTRIILNGPRALLKPAAAQALGMALHELATNAGKYGALSCGEGAVRVEWSITSDGAGTLLKIRWCERNGPAPTPPERHGFGQMIMVEMVKYALRADVRLTYPGSGLIWELEAPARRAVENSVNWTQPPAIENP